MSIPDTPPLVGTASTIAAQTRAGTLTVATVAKAVSARIAAREPAVAAFAHFDPAAVQRQAEALDAAPSKGPLHGVPIGVKDVILTRDMPTEHNTARYRGSRPGIDAACVDTLRSAGALIAGKTVTTEFASTARGAGTHNPHRAGYTSGGSSSGSAAAVADGMVSIGLGTQTGGSTIRPASYCGVFGWKPTWNSISREGLKMYSATCDTLGLYSRSAEDLALLADVFQIEECAIPATLSGLRIGICQSPVWHKATEGTVAVMDQGAALLRAAGAHTSMVQLPAPFDSIHAAHSIILAREGRSAFLNEVRATEGIHDDYIGIAGNRREISADDARTAYRLADQCRGLIDDIIGDYDILLTPSATGEAPAGVDHTGDASFNSMWTVLQVPVVSAPGLTGPTGLPIGLSFVARRYDDRRAIAVAGLAAQVFGRQLVAA